MNNTDRQVAECNRAIRKNLEKIAELRETERRDELGLKHYILSKSEIDEYLEDECRRAIDYVLDFWVGIE